MEWLACILIVPFVVAILALGIEAERLRRAHRKVEDETRDRLAAEAEEDSRITGAILLEGPARAIVRMLDLDGVTAVFIEPASDLFYVLAAEGTSPRALAALTDMVRRTTPVGLRARVVTDRETIPANCCPVQRGVAA